MVVIAGSISPDKEIQGLIDLISNTTEAYTTALFVAPAQGQPLSLLAHQSLSRNIKRDVSIAPGEGLVGWVYKNNESVNVDKFDQDTRRLFFYQADEAIKSFMAVPLPKINGVLAVDSKQRYIFTGKSQKILHQFGQALETALERLSQAGQGLRRAGAMAFLNELDTILGRPEPVDKSFRQAMALMRVYSGAGACCLGVVTPADRDHYFLMAWDTSGDYTLKSDALLLDKGLAGWVMREKKPLVLEKARLGTDKSYIFYPEEPLDNYAAFAGFPVMWGRRLHGVVCLAGEGRLGLDEIRTQGLGMAAHRLAASLEMEFLTQRVAELGRLDPQIGLPHRTYFTERLARMLKLASLRGGGVDLLVIKINDLDSVALKMGQEAGQEILKAVARRLLTLAGQDAELGHLDYGVIGVAVSGKSETEIRRISDDLGAALANWALERAEGRVKLQLETALARSTGHSGRAEDLIRQGLAGLKKPNPTSLEG